jgi:hydrogenase nickel incorporation protein HypA/HybF
MGLHKKIFCLKMTDSYFFVQCAAPACRLLFYRPERIMHEMSYMIRLVNLADETAKQQNAKRVSRIRVRIGETSGVLPEYLHKYYPKATAGTLLENSVLETEEDPVAAVCRDCGASYHPEKDFRYACPVCGSVRADLHGGRGVSLVSIEIDD